MSEPKPINERVSVLEVRMSNHDRIVEDNQKILIKFFDKLDAHILLENENDQILQNTMIQVTSVIEHLTAEISKTNTKLDQFAAIANETKTTVNKAETVWSVLVKVAIVTSVLISGGWAIFEYVSSHTPHTIVAKEATK